AVRGGLSTRRPAGLRAGGPPGDAGGRAVRAGGEPEPAPEQPDPGAEPDGDGPGLRRVHPRAGGERAEAGRRVFNVVLMLRVRTDGGRPPGPRGAIGARVAILTRSVRTTLKTGHFAFNTTTATASLLAARSSSGTSFPPGDTITLR